MNRREEVERRIEDLKRRINANDPGPLLTPSEARKELAKERGFVWVWCPNCERSIDRSDTNHDFDISETTGMFAIIMCKKKGKKDGTA